MLVQEQFLLIWIYTCFSGRFVSGFDIEPDAVPRCVCDKAVMQQAPSTMFDGIQGEVELLQQPDKCDDALLHGKLVSNALPGTHTEGNIGIRMPRHRPAWTRQEPLRLELLIT